jgi:predicted SnoaL-like aldol condensation-catalyzing enzyme
MKHLITTVALGLILGSCSNGETKEETLKSEKMETQTEVSNKEKAVALLHSMESGDQTPIGYINPSNYKQHNLAVADGLEGFGAVMQHAPEGGFKAKVIRSFQDGDYVFTQTEYDFFGDKIGFDVFRFENGQIVEHWDNLLEKKDVNPSGHTQTDGATEVKDLSKTEENKALVQSFIQTVLINGEFDKMGNYFDGDNYIQHNPAIGDGLSGLGTALEYMASQGIKMVFTKNHIVLGEGNFVLAISEGTFAGEATSFYDLFRVENGKIAEHWDVMEPIMPESEWKNQNGKFNF